MYIKYADYTGKLAKGDIVLMSATEFVNGGDKLMNVPVAITPDGKEPIEFDETERPETPAPDIPSEPTETELMQEKLTLLESRLAKVEAVPIVKTALEPIVVIKDPVLTK